MVLSADDETVLSGHLNFWDRLSAEEQRRITAATSSMKYPDHYTLRTGDRSCIGIIVIKTGMLRVYMLSPEGRDITLFRIAAGDVCVLSAACVLDAITFDVCIDSETETEALIISSDVFRKMSESNIYIKEFGYELATERFSEVMWTMQQILFMKFDQRLAVFLLGEVRSGGTEKIMMTHEQIAKYTGSAREVVTRMLNYFSTEGIVSLSRGTITVRDTSRLEKLAESA